jgi:probable HAF family extracellular repeat protein
MKSRIWTWATVVYLFATVTMPVWTAAQDNPSPRHHRKHHQYRLIDLGTFGGPQSIIFGATGSLNNRGMVNSCADTAMTDPYYPNNNPYFNLPSGPDPYIQHAFLWRDGTLGDLGVLPGGTSSCGQWSSESGVVVGASTNGTIDPLVGVPEINAVRWKNGHILNLGTLGGNESIAWSINNRGQIAGGALNAIPDTYQTSLFFPVGATQVHAFLWQDGNMKDLGTLGGPDSNVYSLNERGDVTGLSFIDNTPNPSTGLPTADPFLWKDNRMIDLGTLGGVFGTSNGLNNRDQVIGQSDMVGDLTAHPFFWDRGVLTDIGTLGGDNGSANWINDAGEVVGQADLPVSGHDAFRWKNGVMTDLGNLGRTSSAAAINSSGQIVGASRIDSTTVHAFLWENGGPMVDLNSLVPSGSPLTLTEAWYINDLSEIAGWGQLASGAIHAVLLVPCDEGHPGECEDYLLVDTASTAQYPEAMTGRTSELPLSPIDGIRSMMRQQDHILGRLVTSRD